MNKRELIIYCKTKEKFCIFYVLERKGVSEIFSKYFYTRTNLLSRIPKKKLSVSCLINMGKYHVLQRFIGEEKASPETLIERIFAREEMENPEIIKTIRIK